MTAAVTRTVQQSAGRIARLWWLPAGGYGNGLDDRSWVPALEISGHVVPRVLSALRDAGVPGYAAPAGPAAGGLLDRSGRPGGWQLWVGGSGYGRAEAVLLAAMPSLVREAAERGDRAWR